MRPHSKTTISTGCLTAALALGLALPARAHLGAIQNPKAGTTFKPGDTVTVSWSVDQRHNNQDVAYSTDGTTWTTVQANLSPTTNSYKWVVPATPSTQVRLRICQKENLGGTVSGCTDAQNTQQLGGIVVTGGKLYTAVTGNFTIQSATALAPKKSSRRDASGPRLVVDAGRLRLETAPAGASTPISVDPRGRLVVPLAGF